MNPEFNSFGNSYTPKSLNLLLAQPQQPSLKEEIYEDEGLLS